MGFRTKLGRDIFRTKYARGESYSAVIDATIDSTVFLNDPFLKKRLKGYMEDFKFLPGGRYLYYAMMPRKYTNNCFAFKATDSAEGWAELAHHTMMCLMRGGGVGVNYSDIRPKYAPLKTTGGQAGGPLSLAKALDAVSQQMQISGSRRAALCANIRWDHADVDDFIKAKTDLLVMPYTNISVIFDDNILSNDAEMEVFDRVLRSAMYSGEPGFFFQHDGDDMDITSACQETRFRDNNSACNLASINLAEIESPVELIQVVQDVTTFLVCGSIQSQMPFKEAETTKCKNRTIGLGLMGIHEWLIKNHYQYEPEPLKPLLEIYRHVSRETATKVALKLGINIPESVNAIAPTGSLALLAGTTGGIEPIFATAYERRYFNGDQRKSVVVIDAVAERLIGDGINESSIQTAFTIPFKDRIYFQAYIQDFVDQAISSTVNFNPGELSFEDAKQIILSNYRRLKGLTLYPNSSRNEQPIVPIRYDDAVRQIHDTEQQTGCKDGVCGS